MALLAFGSSDPAFAVGKPLSDSEPQPISAPDGEKKSNVEYWQQDVKIPFLALRPLLSTCYESEPHYRGCVALANRVLMAGKETRALVPAKLYPELAKQELSVYGKVMLALPAGAAPVAYVVNYALPKEKLTDKERIQITRADLVTRRRLSAEWTAIYKSEPAINVDFYGLFEILQAAATSKQVESFVSGLALNAYLNELFDPHTWVMAGALERDESRDASDDFVGIGIIMEGYEAEGQLRTRVKSPIRGSNADVADVYARDEIVQVKDEATGKVTPIAGLTTAQVAAAVRGPEGTSVTVTFRRGGAAPAGQLITKTIKRGRVAQPNVASQLVQDSGIPVAYIKYGSFSERGSSANIAKEILLRTAEGAQAIVLDLRDNGGGLVSEAVAIAQHFMDAGRIVAVFKSTVKTVKNKAGKDKPAVEGAQMTRRAALTKLPTVILIDEGSASASEMLAGSLQENHRAFILGEASFGKATMQSVNLAYSTNKEIAQSKAAGLVTAGVPRFVADIVSTYDIALLFTVARFYYAPDRTTQLTGVIPDFEVTPEPDLKAEDRVITREKDLYANAFGGLGEPWSQPRPKLVKAIQDCVTASGAALKKYKSESAIGKYAADYQLLTAQEAIRCAAQDAKVAEAAKAPPARKPYVVTSTTTEAEFEKALIGN